MKHLKTIIRTSLLTIMIFLVSGCDDFFDINKDPNNPTSAPNSQLLTVAELTMSSMLGFSASGLSSANSILVHQTVQRGSFDQYVVAPDDFNIVLAWGSIYTQSLNNLEIIINQSAEKEAYRYTGIAKILKAYIYSVMVDMWGDVPFSEATKGAAFYTPKFDDDAAIYPQLITLIDEGIAHLAQPTSQTVGNDDIIYKGNAVKWRRFANSLKLKLYNQTRLVQDVADEVNALIAANDFITLADDFEFPYGTSTAPDNRNPGFVNEYTPATRGASYISPYFYEIMTNQSTLNPVLSGVADPRVPYYWYKQITNPAAAQNPTEYTTPDGFLTIHFASTGNNQGFQQDRSQTLLGLYPVGGKFDNNLGGVANLTSGPGNVALRLYPYFSHLYTQAELMLTVPGVTGDARATFNSAMLASFAKVNAIAAAAGAPLISTAARDSYINAVLAKYDAASATGKLELIITEKWIASFGFAIDSYTDYRRTGFPIMYDPNTDDLEYTNTGRDYPVSLIYDAAQLALNPNAPAQKNITTDRVFWDPN